MFDILIDRMINFMGIGYYITVYGIGVLAMAFSVIAFQFKKGITIILSNFLGQVCWVVYFLLQADLASAVVCGLSAIMLALFAKKNRWKWVTGRVSVTVFILLFIGFSLFSFQTWSDVFPLLAGVFTVIANSQATEKRLRQYSILWYLFWVLNSTFKMYPVAFINDFSCTVSAIVSLIRYRDQET